MKDLRIAVALIVAGIVAQHGLSQTAAAPINQPPPTILLITNLAPLQATVGVPYSHQMTASFYAFKDATLFTWMAAALPPGLTMSAAGLISGVPTQAGSYISPLVVTAPPTLWGDGSSRTYIPVSYAWLRLDVAAG